MQKKWRQISPNARKLEFKKFNRAKSNISYIEKARFKDEIFTYAEKLLRVKRSKKRINTVKETKFKCRLEEKYETRNDFVENTIDDSLQYFKAGTLETYN